MRNIFKGFKIVEVGVGLPKVNISNAELATTSPINVEWCENHLGIYSRGILQESESLSMYVYESALGALKDSKFTPELIVVATGTPDFINPGMAMILHNNLKLSDNVMSFDLQAVCNGFLYGLSTALALADNGKANSLLVVGADQFSKITDNNSRDAVYFGDGAGAVYLERDSDENVTFVFDHYAQGENWEDFKTPTNGYFQMNGRAVYNTVKEKVPATVFKLLKDYHLKSEDIKFFVTHQPSKVVLDMLEKELYLAPGTLVRDYAQHGNTASASVPIALMSVWEEYQKTQGTICFISFGAGWSWTVGLYNPDGLR